MTDLTPEQVRLLELLDEICRDSLESSLESVVSDPEYSETQEVSALFLEAYRLVLAQGEALAQLTRERDEAVTRLKAANKVADARGEALAAAQQALEQIAAIHTVESKQNAGRIARAALASLSNSPTTEEET